MLDPPARTEADVAVHVLEGRADAGLAVETVARTHRLDFIPLFRERYDLLVWRREYFEPQMQRLLAFCASTAFAAACDRNRRLRPLGASAPCATTAADRSPAATCDRLTGAGAPRNRRGLPRSRRSRRVAVAKPDGYAAGSTGAVASPSHSSSTSAVCAPSVGGERRISNA